MGLLFAFLGNGLALPPAHAQELNLPAPGIRVALSPAFNPPVLKGLKVHPDNPFRFDFILDKGDSTLANDQLKEESSKLIKYFLASLTVPEKDLWVNLSPYEKDRIVPESFGQTEMGRDLLAQDYLLKQITASLIYPEDELGKTFWKRIYQEANKRFGTTNIPVNTFNKVWIVPEKAVVYENAKAGTAYVVESRLKVMLEQDYLALEKNVEGGHVGQAAATAADPNVSPQKDVNALGSQIVREIVIPALTKEVNENKNFAQLRQIYNSLILATWYKKKIKDSILNKVYADKNKVVGVNIDDPQEKQKIYQQYLKAFKKGVYNYIKEEQDPVTQQMVPRKYFSGGLLMKVPLESTYDAAMVGPSLNKALSVVQMNIRPMDRAMAIVPITDGLLKGLPDAVLSLQDRDLTNVRVLLRTNQNITFNKEGKIDEKTDVTRLKETLPILKFLLDKGASVILIGHNGRKGSLQSLAPTEAFFQEQFPDVSVRFYPKSIDEHGLNITDSMLIKDPLKKGKGSLHILENVRFAEEHETGENGSEKRDEFGRKLAGLAEILITDAYGDIGSEGASIENLPGQFVRMGKEFFVGPSMIQEAGKLATVVQSGVHAVIMGGVKPDKVEPVVDIVNKTLVKDGFGLLGSAPSSKLATNHLLRKDSRVLTAIDYNAPGETLDIGPKTIDAFLNKLDTLKAGQNVIVNGTMGWVEGGYVQGTKDIFIKLGELAKRGVNVIFIGGDGSANAREYGLDQLEHVILITGGGVPLKILAGKKLVGVEAMKEAEANKAMTGEQRIIFPENIQGEIPNDLGEKSEKLIKLKQLGFNVPQFFVVKSNGSGQLVVNDELRQAFDRLKKPVIVRSAHPEEGRKHSYSGVFESFPDIKVLAEAEASNPAIKQLEASYYAVPESVEAAYAEMVSLAKEGGYRIDRYTQAKGITDFNPSTMNAVVMEQVNVDVFGMFVTSDQQHPDKVHIHFQVRGEEDNGAGGVITYDKTTRMLEDNTLSPRLQGILIKFGETASQIEQQFGVQQIELTSSKEDGKVYTLQSRNINLGNPQDVPRYAQYKTMSGTLSAIGYGSYRAPVLVIEALDEATGYKESPEYKELSGRYWKPSGQHSQSEIELFNKQMKELAQKATEQYRQELLTFQQQHPDFILVIKDAEAVIDREDGGWGVKNYDFVNRLISKAKVVIRGKDQNAIRHEDWEQVEHGGITVLPGMTDTFVASFRHKRPKDDFNYPSDLNDVRQKEGNISLQHFRPITTGDYLNVLSNTDGVFVWYDQAMVAGSVNVEHLVRSIISQQGTNTGGIDLNTLDKKLQTQNSNGEIKFYVDPAMLQQLQNAPGFVPIIINIQPMTDLKAFLGVAP